MNGNLKQIATLQMHRHAVSGLSIANAFTAIVMTACLAAPRAAAQNTIIDIQSFRIEKTAAVADPSGQARARVKFVNLNPAINAWYILEVEWAPGTPAQTYHLENPDPTNTRVDLDPKFPQGLMIQDGSAPPSPCALTERKEDSPLETGKKSDRNYAELCNGKLFLRNPGEGRETSKEMVVDFLRRHVWGGEKITSFVKDAFYKDKYVLMSNLKKAEDASSPSAPLQKKEATPPRALVSETRKAKMTVAPVDLGLDLGAMTGKDLEVGAWYPVNTSPGVMVSVIEPDAIRPDILESYPERARKLDATEGNALSYVVAFDMSKHNIGFALGTKHPSMEWSERSLPDVRKKDTKGPDGFESAEPVIRTGGINPVDSARVVATFIAGYKRSHGAFKWGELAQKNQGSHYGFVENGVVFSRLVPDLATMVIYKDGHMDMKNWTEEDNKTLDQVRHARQNGVSVVEWDSAAKRAIPGIYVAKWTQGNWSGSHESQQRTLRAGACLVKDGDKTWLLYAYFSGATSNAMARVFQAYQCNYGMHLDMNALEHTYLAVYSQTERGFTIQHLISGMNVLDRPVGGVVVPRFVGAADNRDFFFMMKK